MVQLRQPNFSNIRRLASSLRAPTLPLPPSYSSIRRLSDRIWSYSPSQQDLRDWIEFGLMERGFDPFTMTQTALEEEDDRTKGQKQVDTLTRRLRESGHDVPEPEDTGRQGFVGTLLNWLGAPGGAVTTLIHDLVNRDGRVTPLRSLREGFTGENRKLGSDILQALGVQNRVGRGVGGFVLDVLLDPTTYLGVGLVRGAATAATRRTAREALEKAGQRATDEELDNIIQRAVGPASAFGTNVVEDARVATVARALGRPVSTVRAGETRAFQQQVENVQRRLREIDDEIASYQRAIPEGGAFVQQNVPRLRQLQNERYLVQDELRRLMSRQHRNVFELSDVAPALPRQANLEIGIPFTNIQRSIADLTPAVERASQAVRSLPSSQNALLRAIGQAGRRAGRTARSVFSTFSNLPPNVANLFRQRQMRINAAMRSAIQLGEKLDRQLGGGVAKNETIHKAIAYSLDQRRSAVAERLMRQLSPEDRKKAQSVQKIVEQEFRKIAEAERRAGILPDEHVRNFYFTHMLTGDREALRLARQEYRGIQPNPLRTTGSFQQSRTLATFDELEDFVQRFNAAHPELGDIRVNYDVGQVLATRKLASEILLQNNKIIDDIINLGPDYARPLQDGRNVEPGFIQVRGLGNSKMQQYVFQDDVARFLEEWARISQPGEELNALVNLWDTVTGAWKALVTATPGFHFRNMIGSIWNNWIAGVRDPQDYTNAMNMIVRGRARGLEPNTEVLQQVRINLPNGQTLNGQDIVRLADQFGVLHAGWAGSYGGRSIEQIGRRSRLGRTLRLEHSREIGEAMDDVARLAGFMNHLKKSGDPYAAALNVKKHLFDYDELSRVEKQIFRRTIPFYTWMRKNIPLQLEALIRKPGMYTGLEHAVQEGAVASGIDIEEMPEYLANTGAIPLGADAEGITRYLTPYSLPANDLFEVLQGVGDPAEAGRIVGQSVANSSRSAKPREALGRRRKSTTSTSIPASANPGTASTSCAADSAGTTPAPPSEAMAIVPPSP